MKIANLYYSIVGYVEIVVEGYSIEKFINYTNKSGIRLWDICRKNNKIMKAKIKIKDFKRIRPIARKMKCGISIKDKKGMPFIIRKYRKRKLFFILLVLVCVIIYFISNFIWNIKLEGNENIPEEEILNVANKYGISYGKNKNKIQKNQFINEIRKNREDLAWIGVEVKGTNVIIKIVEAENKPEIIKKDEFCNIVAKKSGILSKVEAQNGTIQKNEGDVVNKGDIVISGTMEGKYTGVRNVHAQGSVFARVFYVKKGRFYFNQEKKNITGNSENKYEIKINNFQINLYKTLSKFKKYDTIMENKKYKIFANFYLPIELRKIKHYEYITENITYGLEELKKQGLANLTEEMDKEIEQKQNILDRKIQIKNEKRYIEIELIYEVLEEIGTKEKIVF